MRQLVVMLDDVERVESLTSLAARTSVAALLNRSRRTGLAYTVPEDVQQWLDSGAPVDAYLSCSTNHLNDLYERANAALLCPAAVRSDDGVIVAVGIGPFQSGVLGYCFNSETRNHFREAE
ncbi:MAG: hypothetical protein RSG77_14970 [Hafnia sp.]